MTSYIGKDGSVKVGAVAVAEVKSWKVNVSADTLDSTTLDNTGWKTFKHNNLKEWSGSIEALYDRSNATGQGALSVDSTVSLSLYREPAATTGSKYFAGSVIITKVNHELAYDGLVSISFEFQGTGALAETTV